MWNAWRAGRLASDGFRQKTVSRGAGAIRALQQRACRPGRLGQGSLPFYAERLRDVDPARFELRQLPTLTKPEMMANFDRVLTDRRLRRADLEEFLGDPNRLGQWYLGQYAPSRTSGTQGEPALIVQDRWMMELLFALQMTRGTVFPTTPLAILERIVRRARLAVVTVGRGFYPSAAAMAYAPPASEVFVRRLWLTHIEPLEDARSSRSSIASSRTSSWPMPASWRSWRGRPWPAGSVWAATACCDRSST